MSVDQNKQQVRKYIHSEKRKYTLDQKKHKSKSIIERIESLKVFKEASVIMAYWSMDDEVFTHDFVQKYYKQKQIILPVVKSDILELRKFQGLESLITSKQFGIGEPAGEEYKNHEAIELIIVPGVAFDKENNRLGRGKAYYDKLLKSTSACKLGICFDFQLLDNIPVDEFDVKMDMIISES